MINYYFIGMLFIGGFLLILARRWKNPDSSAGYGIAGWIIVILLAYLYVSLLSLPIQQDFEMKQKRYDDSIKIEMKKLEIQLLDKQKNP